MHPPSITADSAAGVIARFLKARGVDRIFALCGGHIMPIWMRADAEGIRIIARINNREQALPGAPVKLVLDTLCTDAEGREVITYAFEPVDLPRSPSIARRGLEGGGR